MMNEIEKTQTQNLGEGLGPKSLESIEKINEGLHIILEQLYIRLEPISAPRKEAVGLNQDKYKEEDILPPYFYQLFELIRSMQKLIDEINDCISNIKL